MTRQDIRIRLALAFAALAVAYNWCFGRFFPNALGRLGHDYSYVLPDLLAGDYWFSQNGPLAVPWFTPAFCGGRPYFADPQSMYYSVPQWLSFVMGPVSAVHVTLILFASLGFLGIYRLARDVAGCSRPAAFLAGAVFMFNGFFGFRTVVGHTGFHSFMLSPLMAWTLLARPGRPGQELSWNLLLGALGALMLGYMVNAGLASLVPASLLAVAVLVLWAVLRDPTLPLGRLVLRSAILLVGGSALSAAHLVASFALIGTFPRSDYLLPGFASPVDTLVLLGKMLFISPYDIEAQVGESLVNVQLHQGQHELEFGLSPLPLLAMLVLAWTWFRERDPAARLAAAIQSTPRPRRTVQIVLTTLLVLLLLIPAAINTYQSDWNQLLKSLPVIGSSSVLIRWFLVYLPLLSLLVAPGLDHIPARFRERGAILGVISIVLLNVGRDVSFYEQQPYPPGRIGAAALALQRDHRAPAVHTIVQPASRAGTAQRNDALTEGYSILGCYYPTFGYGLEHFPVRKLHVGPADEEIDGTDLNVKNPACYVYPSENGCTPGDHFKISDKPRAQRFLAYQTWDFAVSERQSIANVLTLVSLVGLLGIVVVLTALTLKAQRGSDLTPDA